MKSPTRTSEGLAKSFWRVARSWVVRAVLLAALLIVLPVEPARAHHGEVNRYPRHPRAEMQPVSDPTDDPDDECADGGDEDDNACGCDEECPAIRPSSCDPVYLATGRKRTSFTAISVPLSTGSYSLTHSYESDESFSSAPIAGKKWAVSFGRFLEEPPVQPGATAILILHGRTKGKTIFTDAGGQYSKTGPGRQSINVSGDEWVLVTPGQSERRFHKVGEFAGLIKTDTNLRTGQQHNYAWEVLSNVPRLTTLYLNGDVADAEAWIEFTYDAASGLLEQADLHRRPNPTLIVESVKYQYRVLSTDGHTDLGPFNNQSDNSPLNGMGVLTMVTQIEFPSVPAKRRVKVTQFRYHGPNQGSVALFVFQGEPAQLKMEIYPQQIEWAHELYVAAGGLGSLDVWALSLLDLDDGDPIFPGSTIRLIDLAGKVIESYEDPCQGPGLARAKVQFIQSSCGCSGSGTQGTKLEYDYFTYSEPMRFTTTISESYHDGSDWVLRRVTYYDTEVLPGGAGDVPYLVTKAVFDGAQRRWVTHYEYDSKGRRRTKVTPAGLQSYMPGTETAPPSYTASATAGLVRVYDYNQDGRRTKIQVRQGEPDLGDFNDDACTDCTLLEERFYGESAGAEWTLDNSRDHLISLRKRYRKDQNEAGFDPQDDVELTKYFYGFNSGDQVAWTERRVEAELPSENGPGGTTSTFELYWPDLGWRRFSRSADGALTYFTTDPSTGYVISIKRNYHALFLFTGPPYTDIPGYDNWPNEHRQGDGGSLETQYFYDQLGRLERVISPSGLLTYSLRRNAPLPGASGAQAIEYLAHISLPHVIDASTGTTAGPATVAWVDAAGQTVATSTYSLHSGLTYHQAPLDNFSFDDLLDVELSREVVERNVAGQETKRRVWHDLNNPLDPDSFYETELRYDALGRLQYTINPNGTVTENVYDDGTDRVVETRVGVWDPVTGLPTDPRTQVEYFYDHTGGETDPAQGDGNGNLTLVRQHVDQVSATWRVTVNTYDFRDRLERVKSPDKPFYALTEYDNLDRVVKQALFGHDTLPGTPPGIDDTQDRVRYTVTDYSQRGLVYREASALDPGDLSEGYLETHTWCDEVGRPVETWAPTGPATKTTYDGLGRPDAVYVTDRHDDADPAAPNNYADVYNSTSHEAEVDGDVILEQTEYQYIDGTSVAIHAGMLDLVTTRRRTHDATDTDTGDLNLLIDAKLLITTYAGTDFDGADRPIRSINFGTNDTLDRFIYTGAGGASPPTNPGGTWDTTGGLDLVSSTTYNVRGLMDTSADPENQVTKYVYDDLNRQIAVIENHDDVDEADIYWCDPEGRWMVTGGLNLLEPDVDRVTSFVYDGLGNIRKQVAHLPGAGGEAGVQVTEYVYGVLTTGDPASEIRSNDLLFEVIYPEESVGAPPLGERTVVHAYNRQGELMVLQDQNGTRHEYQRDKLGRVELDAFSGSGNPEIDLAVKGIGTKFDGAGRVEFITSYNTDTPDLGTPQSSEIVNEVWFTYTPLWQIEEVWQEPSGAVFSFGPIGDDSLKTTYTYTNQPMSAGNYSRVSSMIYPDTTVVSYEYYIATAGSSDDRISRLKRYTLDTRPILEYGHIGLSMFALVDLVDPDVQLDHTASHDGSRQYDTYDDNPGLYPGFDRFGRVVRHMWVDGDFTTHAPPITTVPNIPPIVERQYTYDKASNRKTAYDDRPGAMRIHRDFQYFYDGLDRLSEAERGANGASWVPAQEPNLHSGRRWTPSQQWSLDTLGNWTVLDTDLTGDGEYDNPLDKTEPRTHNEVNELKDRDPDAPPGPPLNLTYDKAGNLREQDLTSTTKLIYTHDAWNRLVKVQFDDGSQQIADRARYKYNGLNWRIIKRLDSDLTNGYNVLDQARIMYYSAGWQLCEERIDDEGPLTDDPLSPDIDRHVQYVWGQRYIDDILLHRQDAGGDGIFENEWYHMTDVQFSSVALIDDAAALVERVSYDPYGQARHNWLADVDGDGDVEDDDLTTINNLANAPGPTPGTPIESGAYNVEADIDRSGLIDITDYAIASRDRLHPALAHGLLSQNTVDNQIGWDGYVFNAETQQYFVRNRHYDPTLGRWLERDPAGYVDGMNLYEYTAGSAISSADPMGRFKVIPAIHQRITRQGAKLARHRIRSSRLDSIVRSNRATDLGVNFWKKELHATNVGWSDTVRRNMRRLKQNKCRSSKSRSAGDSLVQQIGQTLHTLQDFYSHTDWADGHDLIPVYAYYGDAALARRAADHRPHRGETINLNAIENGASYARVIYFTGGSFAGFADDRHQRYAADKPNFGRGKPSGEGGLGLRAYLEAHGLAVETTKEFFEWTYANLTECCRELIFED